MPGPTVTIFNANSLGATMSVNNGAQFTMPAASPMNWSPSTPAVGGPSWSYAGAAPNVLAPGINTLTITPAGSLQPFVTAMTLSPNVQWNSLQLYIFFNSYGEASWIVLNAGQFVNGNVQLHS
ncbi:hypothetical protein [Caulobacter sp.]|uniref:hypothetical protein n=1 Tax=Caulobacter sp. TaxID=78 RepID=UPI003BB16538